MPTKQSGFLIKSSFGEKGNFELVLASRRGGFAHFWRANDLNRLPWIGPQLFGSSSVSIPSLLQNDQGPLEVFARSGSRVITLSRKERWTAPKFFGSGQTGNPAVIQSAEGQLHMIIPSADGGFAHFIRPASVEASWETLPAFATETGIATAVALIQSNFGEHGNLEIVAVLGAGASSFLAHFWRSSCGVWIGPEVIPLVGLPSGAFPTGVPAFLQSRHGSKGNFEVIVPLSTGGLAHITRDSDTPDLHWNPARTLATGKFSAVSVVQSSFGSSGPGNFELVGCVDNRIEHYWCDDQSLEWHGPSTIIYSEPATNPELTGDWRIDQSCEPVGSHAALLHTNRLLFFSCAEHDQTHGVASIFNLNNHSVEHIPQDEDLFCSGHAFLADGRLLVAGGEKSIFLFTPAGAGGSWQKLPDLPLGRCDPTCTTLPDGTVFVLGGTKQSGGGEVNDTYQIFHPALGLQPPQPAPFLNETTPFNTRAFVFVLPTGQLFVFSADRACLFDLVSKTFGAERLFCKRHVPETHPLAGTSVLLPLMADSNPPYRARVLSIGGGGLAGSATCEILDFGDSNPAWKETEPMSTPRVLPDAVLLPDGTVLVMSGSPVSKTEIFDPTANTWRPMGEKRISCPSHATALLLADGTVMTAGMDRLEIFYPPYLFKGPRPQLQSTVGAITYGMVFGVQSEDAAAIQSFALVRAGSVTHSFNMDQRHVSLVIAARSATTIAVKAPPDANVAPPGCYLLFALNAERVPSEGKFVFVS